MFNEIYKSHLLELLGYKNTSFEQVVNKFRQKREIEDIWKYVYQKSIKKVSISSYGLYLNEGFKKIISEFFDKKLISKNFYEDFLIFWLVYISKTTCNEQI